MSRLRRFVSAIGSTTEIVSAVITARPSSRRLDFSKYSRMNAGAVCMTIVPFWENVTSTYITPSCEALGYGVTRNQYPARTPLAAVDPPRDRQLPTQGPPPHTRRPSSQELPQPLDRKSVVQGKIV